MAASLSGLSTLWSGRFSHVAMDTEERMGLEAALVRPDGLVVWASDAEPTAETFVEGRNAVVCQPHQLKYEKAWHKRSALAYWLILSTRE